MEDRQVMDGPVANNDDGRQPQVLCVQIGARDHYAIPRALHRRGALAALVTDFWWPWRGAPELPLIRRLRGRSHPDLRNARVLSMNLATLRSEAISRMTQRRHWEQFMCSNQLFQTRALRHIPWDEFPSRDPDGGRPVLFAYSYAALDLLRQAKHLGWTTLLGQIDPGPLDSRVADHELQQWPEFGSAWRGAPTCYYDLWRKEIALADRIIVNSEWSRQALITEGVAPGSIVMIPLPYEEPVTAGHPAKDYPTSFTAARPLRVLFLGQVNLRKGVPALLTAMEMLSDQPLELWMAGPRKLELPVRFATATNIRWLGPITRDSVGKLYRDADVLVFPTHSDGFGLTQLEAQSWRLPLIASRNCGEVVVDQHNGMRLHEVTPECIMGALKYCCSNPHALRQWSIHSGVAPHFRLEAAGQALMQVIHDAQPTTPT